MILRAQGGGGFGIRAQGLQAALQGLFLDGQPGSEFGLFGEFAVGVLERFLRRFERGGVGGAGSQAVQLVLEGSLFERQGIRGLGLLRELAIGLRQGLPRFLQSLRIGRRHGFCFLLGQADFEQIILFEQAPGFFPPPGPARAGPGRRAGPPAPP